MQHRIKTLSSLSALLMGFAAAQGLPTTAEAAPPQNLEEAPGLSPEMLRAMQRDFRLSEAQARQRLAVEARAGYVEAELREALKDGFGGAWMNAEGTQLVVGITDPAEAARVRRAGAEPRVVNWSLVQLEDVKAVLDRNARRADPTIRAWYVDPATNSVVVISSASSLAESRARAFVTDSGASTQAVRIEPSAEDIRLFEDLRGGDAYFPGASRCSIGFPVKTGFVTAGHCGGAGTWTSGFNWASQGVVQGSSFPGNDYAWVQTEASWVPTPWVNLHNQAGGLTHVNGSQERTSFYSSVCRSGSTTGMHCGVILARNATVNYAVGSVYGLTKTTVCSEPGDSGGAFFSGDQAQGVTSGGTGDCTNGGTTYFQPINPILSTYRLSLTTAGPIASGFNVFSTLHSGMCLDVNGGGGNAGANIIQQICHYAANQQFRLVPLTSGYYQIIAAHSGQCLDVQGANSTSGAAVTQYPCHGGANQQFALIPLASPGNDVYRITARHSGQCLDVQGGNSSNGAKVTQYPCHNGANQQFVLK
jgi:streptogrisin C